MLKKSHTIAWIVSLVVLLFAGIGTYYWMNLDPFRHEKKIIAESLNDPASAAFRGLVRGEDAVCGYVNGKNKFGGYAGERLFMYTKASGVKFPEDRDQKTCIEPKLEMPRLYGDGMSYYSDILAANERFKRQSHESIACAQDNLDKLKRILKFIEEVERQCPGIE